MVFFRHWDLLHGISGGRPMNELSMQLIPSSSKRNFQTFVKTYYHYTSSADTSGLVMTKLGRVPLRRLATASQLNVATRCLAQQERKPSNLPKITVACAMELEKEGILSQDFPLKKIRCGLFLRYYLPSDIPRHDNKSPPRHGTAPRHASWLPHKV